MSNICFSKKKRLISALTVVALGLLLYISANLQVQYEVELVQLPVTDSVIERVRLSQAPVANFEENVKVLKNADYNQNAIELYKAYYLMEMKEWGYAYACYDCDNDGKLELLLKDCETGSISSSDIMKYEKNGLRHTYEREYDEIPVNILEWNMDADVAGVEENKCIRVDVAKSTSMEHYWYLNEKSFVEDFGFAGATPFYEYNDLEDNLYMKLYFDEETEEGCGIIYLERGWNYGFAFSEVMHEKWAGMVDYFDIGCAYGDGDTGKNLADESYVENYEYDNEGRVIHFESTGVFDWYSDEPERCIIMELDFEYDERGKLLERSYCHATRAFGSTYACWDCVFDEQERILYELIYVTHGDVQNFYIYFSDREKPDYVLLVDSGWDISFTKYDE